MSESQEAQMARHDERIKSIIDNQATYRKDMTELSNQFGQMFQMLSNIENRLKVVEESMEPNADMLEEYNALKHEVAGARRIMKVIWGIIAGLFALGLTLRNEIASLLNN